MASWHHGILCMVIGIWLQSRLTVPVGPMESIVTQQSEPKRPATGVSPAQSSETDTAPASNQLAQEHSATQSSNPTDTRTDTTRAPSRSAKKVTYGRLEGRVTNEEGAPLKAAIYLGSKVAFSDTELGGTYVLPKVEPGTYNVTVKRGHRGNFRPQIIYGMPIYAGRRTWLKIVASEGDDLQEVAKPQAKIDDAVQGGPMPK